MRNITCISSEADYDQALAEVAYYFANQPALGTEAAERFEVLARLIEIYEAQHWPIEPVSPPLAVSRHSRPLTRGREKS